MCLRDRRLAQEVTGLLEKIDQGIPGRDQEAGIFIPTCLKEVISSLLDPGSHRMSGEMIFIGGIAGLSLGAFQEEVQQKVTFLAAGPQLAHGRGQVQEPFDIGQEVQDQEACRALGIQVRGQALCHGLGGGGQSAKVSRPPPAQGQAGIFKKVDGLGALSGQSTLIVVKEILEAEIVLADGKKGRQHPDDGAVAEGPARIHIGIDAIVMEGGFQIRGNGGLFAKRDADLPAADLPLQEQTADFTRCKTGFLPPVRRPDETDLGLPGRTVRIQGDLACLGEEPGQGVQGLPSSL